MAESSVSTDIDKGWVEVDQRTIEKLQADIVNEDSSAAPSKDSTFYLEGEASRQTVINQVGGKKQSLVGRILSAVPSLGSVIYGPNPQEEQALPGRGVSLETMAAINQEKSPKKRPGTGVMQRMKGLWKSEDAVDDRGNGSVQAYGDDESVVATVLRENTELHEKYASVLRRLSDCERQNKGYIKNIEQLQKLVENLRAAPARGQIPHEKSERDHRFLYSERQHDKLRSVSREHDNLEQEVSRLNEESRVLRQSLDQATHQSSSARKELEEKSEQAKHFELKYQTEKENNVKLRAQVKQLEKQFEAIVDMEPKLEDADDKDQSKVTIARLQGRIKQLNEDVSKLREHSKSQSNQILRLRQQTEVTKHMEEQVCSMDILLREAEDERDQLRSKLIQVATEDNELDKVQHHKGTGQVRIAQPTSENAQLQTTHARVAKDVQAMQRELYDKNNTIKDLKKSNRDLENQIDSLKGELETVQLQVELYKSDFEEERKDREAAHSKMADMEKRLVQLEGRSGHERATYAHEVGELERDNEVIKEQLQARDQELQKVKKELEKHKCNLADLEVIHQKRVVEAKNDLLAKASQVKQYAKENETLKQQCGKINQQLEAAMECIKVMAEEMHKDRRKAFELQEKLDKHKKHLKTKPSEGKKSRKGSVSGHPKPADGVIEEVQELSTENDRLVEEVETLSAEKAELANEVKRLQKAQHDMAEAWNKQLRSACARNPTVVNRKQQQPCQAGLTDDFISSDLGTAGTGEFIQGKHPSSQQQPLRALAPHGPPQGDPHQPPSAGAPPNTLAPRDTSGMNIHVQPRSGQSGKGSRQSGGHSHGAQPVMSQPAFSKLPPTVQHSGVTAHDAVISPVHASSHLPKTQLPTSVSVRSPSSKGIHPAPKSAPIPAYIAPQVVSGEQYYSDKIPQQLSENSPEGGSSSGHPQKLLPIKQKFDSFTHEGSHGLSERDEVGKSHSQPLSFENKLEGRKSASATPSPSLSPSQGQKSMPQKTKNVPLSPLEPHIDQPSPTSASEVKAKSGKSQLNDSTNQFENPLQRKLDDEIQQHAADVIREVSGNQQEDPENGNRPFDPNLICPMCMKKFRIGEIQFFKRHVNTCDGTDDEPGHGDGITGNEGDWV